MEPDGEVVVITGGSQVIGKGIALALAQAGAGVVINYRKDDKAAEETAAKIKELGRKALAVGGDVSSDRGDINDIFFSILVHVLQDGFRTKEGCIRIRGKHPLLLRKAEGSGAGLGRG